MDQLAADKIFEALKNGRVQLGAYDAVALLSMAIDEIARLRSENASLRVNESAFRAGAAEFQKTTDAEVWAEEFCRIVGEKIPAIKDEREWIFRWFTNAIGAGERAGRRDARKELDCLREKLVRLRDVGRDR